ncbi:MAG: alpha-amylase domain-containing protein [Cyanobacteriota bacterium]
MGVILQAFYFDCPEKENKEFEWWNFLTEQISFLKEQGFSALWLPPASKGSYVRSMGYDPYDYYDLGEFEQKGGIKTWFGSKNELLNLIKNAHDNQIQLYADIIINHNNGGDEQELNPIDNQLRWTKFNPQSKKFYRDWKCFHPSPYMFSDEGVFGEMPDFCHTNPYVTHEFIKYTRWMIEEIGFDGFRYDYVKAFTALMVRHIQEASYFRNNEEIKPYGIGEFWDTIPNIKKWLNKINCFSNNSVNAFDFPLRSRLRDLCNNNDYDLNELSQEGTILNDMTSNAVTFVENHDTDLKDPIVKDKMLAYSYILTHEGYPCIFWKDFFNYALSKIDSLDGISALIQVHENFAVGSTSILYVDKNLYIMQRNGVNETDGLIFILNNSSEEAKGNNANTKWKDTILKPIVFSYSENMNNLEETYIDPDGVGYFVAPPRGYAVYVIK